MAAAFSRGELNLIPEAVGRAQARHERAAALREELATARETIQREQDRTQAHAATIEALKKQRNVEDRHAHDLWLHKELGFRDEARGRVNAAKGSIRLIEEELANLGL